MTEQERSPNEPEERGSSADEETRAHEDDFEETGEVAYYIPRD